MNKIHKIPSYSNREQVKATHQLDEEEINLLDLIWIIAKNSKMIVLLTGAAVVLSGITSLLLPNIYCAKTEILLSQQDQGGKLTSMAQMEGLAGFAGDMLAGESTIDLYVEILRSEALKDIIIDRFHLMDVYDKESRLDTYKTFDDNLSTVNEAGVLSISVEDRDPKRSTDITNALVEELEKVTVKLNIVGAERNKKFFEKRLVKSKVDLAKAEDKLKAYQAKNKALDVTEQTKATIEGVARLKAELTVKEVQLASLRAYMTDENDEIKTIKASIINLKERIDSMEGSGSGSSILTVGAVPALGQEYLRLTRDLKIQESIFELLTNQYEMAKLYEAKDFPGIYILQQARIPDKKVKPKRLLIVIIYTLFAFLLSITFAFLREHQERMSKKEKMQWREIKKDLRLSLKTLLIFILIASILILSLIFIKNFQDKDQGEKKISYEIISSEDN
jgi:uncharacterized protein involved in exopolysaccharide biosynthesis